MRWPLVLFALLLVVLGLGRAVSWRARWAEALEGALPAFALFAALAVLMIAYGKPSRPAQYAAWGLLGAQTLRAAAALWAPSAVRVWALRLPDLASYVLLAYLWVRQSPLFDTLPP